MVWRDDLDQVCVEPLSPLFAMLIEQMNQRNVTGSDLYQLTQSALSEFSQQEIQTQIYSLKALLTRLRLIHIPHNNDETQG